MNNRITAIDQDSKMPWAVMCLIPGRGTFIKDISDGRLIDL